MLQSVFPRHHSPVGMMGRYRANAVTFDGTNDFLERSAGLTGAADSKLWTGSLWLRKQGSDGGTERLVNGYTLLNGGVADLSTRVAKTNGNLFQVLGNNAAGTAILNMSTTGGSVEVADGWRHILWSVDMADTGKRHLYLNDVSDLATIAAYTDDTIDFTLADWGIGGNPDGTVLCQVDLADVWMKFGVYVDFSVTANRRLFITGNLKPAYLGADGTRPGLGTPEIFMSGATSAWETNKGGGGGFTENGALSDAATSPSD